MRAVPLEQVRKGESQQVLLEVVLDSEGEQEPADPRRGDAFQTAGTEGGQARLLGRLWTTGCVGGASSGGQARKGGAGLQWVFLLLLDACHHLLAHLLPKDCCSTRLPILPARGSSDMAAGDAVGAHLALCMHSLGWGGLNGSQSTPQPIEDRRS